MSEELISALVHFDNEQVVVRACRFVHNQDMYCGFPKLIIGAWRDGLLEIRDDDGDLKDNRALYTRLLILTDKGRAFCGMEALSSKKKSQATLFD